MSRFAQFIDSEVVQRWASTIATILFPVLILPSAVEDASALNWALLLIVIGGSVAFLATAITKWRKHYSRRKDA